MSLNSTAQLASLLAEQTRETDEVKTNISPDDLNSSLPIFINESPIRIIGEISVGTHTYATNAFILDHPIYCDLDSSVYALDGGYSAAVVTVYTVQF